MRRRQPFCQQNELGTARHLTITINLIRSFQSLWLQKEENRSFAVGHLALGYISSKTSAKLLKTKLNIPLVLTLSVVPDIDIFIQTLIPTLEHRGPTHSIIMALIAFIPIFAIYHKKATPYLVALIGHSLVGDYITGQTQLLWPTTTQSYGTGIDIVSQTNVTIELLIFLASIAIMVKTRDAATLLQPHKSNLNLTLSIPTFTVLLPTFISFPSYVPTLLIVPHLIYIFIFSASIIIDLRKIFTKRALRNSNKL